MPRSLEQVQDEILRVAKDLDLDPRSPLFSRRTFLKSDPDVTRHDIEQYGGWAKVKADAAHVAGLEVKTNGPETRGVELRNNYVRRLERIVGAKDYFGDRLAETMEKTIKANPVKLNKGAYKTSRSKAKPNQALTLVWSDLHFGVDVNDFEVLGSNFNWTIAARRMAMLCVEAVEHGANSDVKELRVVLNGDIMQGVIHLDDTNIKPMTEQIWAAASIRIAAIDYLSQHFVNVTVVCLPGNHDRMTYKNSSRELSQRWDSHAHSLYLALMLTFKNTKVEFDIPSAGIAFVDDLNGGLIMASHGDTAPDSKNVSRSISVGHMADTLLRIQESKVINKKISVAIFGHWHTPTVQMLPNGACLIVNGSLIGGEPFGQNGIGTFNPEPAQIMFISRTGRPVSNVSIVCVREADDDTELDKVIPTPKFIHNGKMSV